jgi:hypothetical protein
VSFNNILIKIFKSHGFEINSSSNYSKYILASKDNINLSIGYNEVEDVINVGNIRSFFRSAKKDNADMMIYIIPSTKYPENIDKFASDRNIQLWGRERLERELGKALMENLDSMGEVSEFEEEMNKLLETTHELSGSSEAEDILSIRSDSMDSTMDTDSPSVGEEIPIMVPIIPFDDDGEFIGVSSSVQDSTTSTTPLEDTITPQSPPSPEHAPQSDEVKIIKPMVSKEKAAEMANKIVRGFRFNLELIPYYIFDYSCSYESEIGENASSSGVIGINGLTSNIEEWSGNISTVRKIYDEHTKLETKFPYDKALSLAQQAVVELNTKFIETREESESTIIFEKKKLKPKSDAIELSSQGIYYLPVWCIEGSNGLMIIDASSGKIIKEDFF